MHTDIVPDERLGRLALRHFNGTTGPGGQHTLIVMAMSIFA